MSEQPTDIDPQHLPVDYTNTIPEGDPNVEVAPDQTPEPDTDEEA